jgi:flavin-dependent dehydrogenase
MNSYDVVIIGGRVAGASTALLLARAGARVAVIDRSRAGSDTVSTHALMRAGVLQLSRWGMLERVVALGTPAVGSTQFHYADARSVRVTIRPSAGVDALYAPRRYMLDGLLIDAAAEAGAEVLHETTLTAVRHDENGRVRGVRAATGSDRAVELRASTTVGADGIRSIVAEHVRAPVLRRGRHRSAVLYRYDADLPADGYEWAYGTTAAAGLIPTNGGQTCVFVSTTPERMRELRRPGAENAFSTLLSRAAPTLLERIRGASPVGRIRGWAGVSGYIRRPWGPGWALVGDAGYFKDPIMTHGMTDAMRDAELLATAILESNGGAVPELSAFARYQATRDRLSAGLFAATEKVAAYDWSSDGIQTLLRRLSSAMSDEVDYLEALSDRQSGQGVPACGPADIGPRIS